jgi:hypothetical protein
VTGTLSDIALLRLSTVYMHPPSDAIVRGSVELGEKLSGRNPWDE